MALKKYSEEKNLVSLIAKTFNCLAAQSDLSPRNPVVNESLSQYVGTIIRADALIEDKDIVLNDPVVQGLMRDMLPILSRAEFAMEQYFTASFLQDGPQPLSGLNRFWYRANYQALVENEVKGISAFADDISKDSRPMAFVGSGPLPLSAVDYYLLTGKSCVCIEMVGDAAQSSRQLIQNLGLDDVITVLEQDGSMVDYSPYSMVFVAALVDNKDQVLDRIRHTASGAMVGIRSAEGLKKLLYAPIDTHHVERHGYHHCGTTHGTPDAVNSTCFFRLK